MIPESPKFTVEDWHHVRTTGDFTPLLFEWYKFVGLLVNFCSNIQFDSPALRTITRNQYHVLVGLLNRCARLMLANIALSHEGKFGETTAILDRCIFESALNIIWLCSNTEDGKFERYFATSLKVDLEFRDYIKANIAIRGETIPIEERMLRSIESKIDACQLTEERIIRAKKMPPVDAIMRDLNLERMQYVVAQKIGSHHVHGTWSSLLSYYLEEDNSDPPSFHPRDHNCSMHINQYMYVSQFMLKSLRSYVTFLLEDPDANPLIILFDGTENDIIEIYKEAIIAEDLKRQL